MIDLSDAQLDPYRSFHYFHEDINIHIKISIASAALLVRHTADPSSNLALGEIIKLSHPAWNAPPIWSMSTDNQKNIYRSISAFSIVSIFSAFDDHLVATQAELDRHYSNQKKPTISEVPRKKPPNQGNDTSTEHVINNFYQRAGWNIQKVNSLLTIAHYFRICRNCIAHRASRSSSELESFSKSRDLHQFITPLLESGSNGIPEHSIDDNIFIDPTLAILCSHVLREIAKDMNENLIQTLGMDGFLYAVAHHSMFSDRTVETNAYRLPEAVFNNALIKRYRAKVLHKHDSIAELKRIGIWKDYVRCFEKKYK